MNGKTKVNIRRKVVQDTELGKENSILIQEADAENRNSLSDLRNRAFDNVAKWFAFLGIFPIALGAYFFVVQGQAWAGFVQTAFFLSIVGITRNRNISFRKRRILFIGGYYGLSMLLLVLTGPNGAGFILVSSVLALGGILLNKRESMRLAYINIVVFIGLTLLLYSGSLDRYGIYELKETWFLLATTSQSLGIIILMLIGNIYSKLEHQAWKLQRSKAAVEESEERFQLLFEKAPLGYQALDSQARFLDVNQQWLDTLGYEREDVLGRWFGDFMLPEDGENLKTRFPQFKKIGRVQTEFAMVRKNGEVIFVEFNGKIGYNDDGSFKQTHCILKDITEQRKIEEALKASEERHKRLYEYSGIAIRYFTLEGVVVSFNRKAAADMGGGPEDFKGKRIQDIFDAKMANQFRQRIRWAAASDSSLEYEDKMVVDGREIWLISTVNKILDAEGQVAGVQIASLDITKQKALERELFYSSHHDFLTGLYNRRHFESQLQKVDNEENLPLSIVMADVNGLKLINDSFGHDAGDRLLIAAAKAIREGCRGSDTIARIGGDEFAILMPRTDRTKAEALIGRMMGQTVHEWSEHFALSVSFGLATKKEMDEEVDEIYVEAENRMYKQKIYESSSMRSKAIDVIMNSLYEKSQRELSHSKRVGWLSAKIAEYMGFAPERVKMFQLAGLVHDIGKIGVEEKILNKAGKLDKDEWDKIKNHPEAGWRILSSVHEFSEIANYVMAHHEWWDGSGYPKGLEGEEIPLEARIIAVADAFDAMTSKRTYGVPMSVQAAHAEIKKHAGTQFDPVIAAVFLEHFEAFKNQVNFTDESNFTSLKLSAQSKPAD